MRKLIIDIGNTLYKAAVFDNQTLIEKFTLQEFNLKALEKKINFSEINLGLISSTRQKPEKQISALEAFFKVIWLDHEKKLPFTNLYSTPKTLGLDRIALAAACVQEFPNQNTLVIDGGTCLTYEFVNDKAEYLGGAISPGLEMRFKALAHFTHALPLIEKQSIKDFVGDSTENSILSGVINGITQEIDGIINQYSQRFPKLNVVLTGGDEVFFAECLKNNFFARPEFLLNGLNYIAELNA